MPQKLHLTLLIHAHQPCGNFEHVLEKAYDSSYLPFIEHLEKHPGVRLGLHYSGPLLTWIEKHRPDHFARRSARADYTSSRLSRETLRPASIRRLARRARLGAPTSHRTRCRERRLHPR